MLNQQKGVQQKETAYSAVIVNIPVPLHSILLIYHPYPPSFHEMIFILAPVIFLR